MREHWTLDADLIYLNHGSFGAVPVVTQQQQHRLQAAAEANPMRWFRELPERLAHTREVIARHLGVAGDDIAFVPNATAGMTIALRSVEARPGQRFLLTSHAYGGVRLAARRIAAERGCEVVVADIALDATDEQVLAVLERAVDETTACVVVDQITSSTAKVFPVERIARLGRRRGVPVIVDGAHAPGLIDDPVVGDFWTGNLHKWLCAPRGTGVLYVDPSRRAVVVPPTISWGDPLGFPRLFDTPGTIDSTGWLAAPTALDLLDTLGFAGERKRLGALVAEGAELVAAAIGESPVDVGNPAVTMRLVRLPDGLVTDDVEGARLNAFLASRTGVEVALTTWAGRGFLRLSAHLYNTLDDFAVAAARFGATFADPGKLADAARP